MMSLSGRDPGGDSGRLGYPSGSFPVFQDVSDLSINQYENIVSDRTELGMVFKRCVSVWADKIAVGGETDIDLLAIEETVDSHFNSVLAANSTETGIVFDNCRGIDLCAQTIRNNVGIEIKETGTNTQTNERNNIYINSHSNDQQGLVMRETVTGDLHRISGNVYNNGAPMEIQAESPENVILDQMYIDENDGVAQLVLPPMLEDTDDDDLIGSGIEARPENGVRIFNSHVPTIEGEPRILDYLGREKAPAEQPDPTYWERGDVVEFVDTGDGTGNGVYLRLPDETWSRIGDIGL